MRVLWKFILALLIAAALFAWSLSAFSTFAIGRADVLSALTGAGDTTAAKIVHRIRLPRSVAALLIGATLGICGLLMQGISRNRLASPTMLGVTGGASLGLAIVSSGLVGASMPGGVAAVIGGAVAWSLVFVLGTAWSEEASRGRLVLAGMTMGALCAGLTRLVVLLAEERALGVLNWLAGSLSNIRWPDVHVMGIVLIGSLAFGAVAAPSLNLMNLGAESARALGVRLGLLRLSVFAAGCVMVGATVAVAGPIGFIGLMAPNISRLLVGSDHRILVPMSGAVGAIALLAADIVARGVAFPAETPAGAVTALIGAPFFLILARGLR
jgi:iron complex transport system permease protein